MGVMKSETYNSFQIELNDEGCVYKYYILDEYNGFCVIFDSYYKILYIKKCMVSLKKYFKNNKNKSSMTTYFYSNGVKEYVFNCSCFNIVGCEFNTIRMRRIDYILDFIDKLIKIYINNNDLDNASLIDVLFVISYKRGRDEEKIQKQ